MNEEEVDIQLRSQALHLAAKDLTRGDGEQRTKEVVARAEAYFNFLKGTNNGS